MGECSNPNLGKPLPGWVDSSWLPAIELKRREGYGILEEGTDCRPEDICYYITPDTGYPWDDPGTWDLWKFRPHTHDALRADDVEPTTGERLLVLRPGHIEGAGQAAGPGGEHGDGPLWRTQRKWDCGHRRGIEARCIVCAVVYGGGRR